MRQRKFQKKVLKDCGATHWRKEPKLITLAKGLLWWHLLEAPWGIFQDQNFKIEF